MALIHTNPINLLLRKTLTPFKKLVPSKYHFAINGTEHLIEVISPIYPTTAQVSVDGTPRRIDLGDQDKFAGGIFVYMGSLKESESASVKIGIGGECPQGCIKGVCSSYDYVECTGSWNCTKWTPCFEGKQIRNCSDLNHCGANIDISQLIKACSVTNDTANQTSPMTSVNNTSIYVLVKNVSFIGGVEVKVEKSAAGTKLFISNSEINSKVELVERDKKVYAKTPAGEKEIKVLPWDAEDSAKKIDTVKIIEIEEYKGKPVYSISGTKKAYLLFAIPLTADVNQKVSLEDGKVVYTKKPWWHFLALGV